MAELPAEERGDFLHFQQALVRRYAYGAHLRVPLDYCRIMSRDYNLLIISRTCTSYLVG